MKDRRWWSLEDEREISESLCNHVHALETAPGRKELERQWVEALCMYSDTDFGGYLGYMTLSQPRDHDPKRNLIAKAVNTIHTELISGKPSPKFLTSGGTCQEQRQARMLDKLTRGIFQHCKFYEREAMQVVRDALIFGMGVIKFWDRGSDVKSRRIMTPDILLDPRDARDGEPTQIYQLNIMSRWELIDMFPEHKDAIESMADINQWDMFPADVQDASRDGLIHVVSAWKTGEGGKHAIIANDKLLHIEDWDDPLPFAFYQWYPGVQGMYGRAVPTALAGLQLEHDRLARNFSEAHDRIAQPRWFVPLGSQVSAKHLTGKFQIIKYNPMGGARPFAETPAAYTPETYKYAMDIRQGGLTELGINEMVAGGQKPGGVTAASALRLVVDTSSKVFKVAHDNYARFIVDCAWLAIRTARGISGYKVKFSDTGSYETIKGSQVSAREDKFIIQAAPVSSLPQTAAGKLQASLELFQMQIIDKRMFLQMNEIPDVESVTSLESAPYNIIIKTLESIVSTGKFTSPEPLDDLDLCVTVGTKFYAKLRATSLPDDAIELELVRQYIATATELMKPPPLPGPSGPPGMPPGPTGPLPVPQGPPGMQADEPPAPVGAPQ